jgi:hypothetical protein
MGWINVAQVQIQRRVLVKATTNLRVLYKVEIFDLLPKNEFGPGVIQGVPLAIEPGITLIILTQMKILQRNLNSSTFVV